MGMRRKLFFLDRLSDFWVAFRKVFQLEHFSRNYQSGNAPPCAMFLPKTGCILQSLIGSKLGVGENYA